MVAVAFDVVVGSRPVVYDRTGFKFTARFQIAAGRARTEFERLRLLCGIVAQMPVVSSFFHDDLGKRTFIHGFHIAQTAAELRIVVGIVFEGYGIGCGFGGLFLP